jgi:hypothetical protein
VPLLPPLVLVAAPAVARIVAGRRRRVGMAMAALALWFVAAPGHASEEMAFQRYAADYSAPRWHRSPMMRWLGAHPPRGAVFSNDPWALFERGHVAAEVAPAVPDDEGESFESDELQDVRDSVATGRPTYVVWLAEPDGQADPADALATVFFVAAVHRERDGALYLVRRR